MTLSWRLKLTLAYAGVFVATIVLAGLVMWFAARTAFQGTVDATLLETARLAQLSLARTSAAGALPSDLPLSDDTTVQLLDARGAVIGMLGDAELDAVPLTPGFQQAGRQRVYTLALNAPGGGFVRVTRPLGDAEDFLEDVTQVLLTLIGALVLIAGVSGYLLAGRALRPVREVALTARRIARSGAHEQRVRPLAGSDEMAQLVGTVNGMLDRLQGTIEHERSFARTAAHELRTPLTALKGRLELALARPRDAQEYQRSLMGMQDSVEKLIALTERLLHLARAGQAEGGVRAELGAVTLEAVELLEGEAHKRGQQFRLSVTERWVQADPTDLHQAVVNLLENALKYGSQGQAVYVTVNAAGLSVRDEGAGPNQQEWERLLRPFERGANTAGVPGSGLGLSLVASFADTWGVRLEPQWDEGSFTVHLHFPPVAL